MAQQGSPPRRPSRQPDPEHRAGWQGYEPFGPEDEADLPPWAAPSSYQERPGGSRLRPAGQRGGRGRNRHADPYADEYADPYAEPAHADHANRDGAGQDSAYQERAQQERVNRGVGVAADPYAGDPYADGSYPEGSSRGGDHQARSHRDTGYRETGLGDAGDEGQRYHGRRRAPDTLAGEGEDTDGSGYELAETGADPELPAAGGGRSRRRGRAAATRLRKSRRRVYRWSAVAIVIVLLTAGGVWLFGRSTPAPTPWVTKLLAGEYKAVPNACTAVDTSVLNAYLPASGRTERVSVGSGTNSQCSYTFDKQPTFLVLQIAVQALQPFAAAGNNGSATANAQLNFTTARQALARPAKKSPLPPAMITPLTGQGQQAIVAIQHEHVSGIGTDVVTVVIRERNVLLTVSASGQESGHGFGPVPDATLTAFARAVAAGVLAKAESEPTA